MLPTFSTSIKNWTTSAPRQPNHPVHWKHTYSLPTYVGLYLLASNIAKKGIDCGKSFQEDSNP